VRTCGKVSPSVDLPRDYHAGKTDLGHQGSEIARHAPFMRLIALLLVNNVLVYLIVGEEGTLGLKDLHYGGLARSRRWGGGGRMGGIRRRIEFSGRSAFSTLRAPHLVTQRVLSTGTTGREVQSDVVKWQLDPD